MEDIKVFSLSFKGRRENNEDSYIEIRPNSRSLFIAVADGMGGAAGGEKASGAVIECCKKIIEEKISEDKIPDLKQVLRKIYFESQVTIRNIIKEQPELNGMGTTLACLLMYDDKYAWGNLGDSRIYRLSGSGINLITKDHTHIQDFIDKSDRHISKSLIENYSNFLTRSIDGSDDEPDIFPEMEDSLMIQKGESIFICSDGLINNKAESSPEEFYEIILGSKNIEDSVRSLVRSAYQKGSSDNITVVLLEKGKLNRKKAAGIKANKISAKESPPPAPARFNKKPAIILGSMIILILSAILFNLLLKEEKIVHKQVGSFNKSSKNIKYNVKPPDSVSQAPSPVIPEKNKPIEEFAESTRVISTPRETATIKAKETRILVPDLIGDSEDDAKRTLEKIGLTYEINTVQGLREKIGIVLFQAPKAGEFVSNNSKITMTIGK